MNDNYWSCMESTCFLFLNIFFIFNESNYVMGISSSQNTAEQRCEGIGIDTSRLVSLKDQDEIRITESDGGRRFSILSSQRILDRSTSTVIGERIRMQETIQGVNIYGANAIVTISPCRNGEVCRSTIEGIWGKTYESINVLDSVPGRNESEAKKKLTKIFGNNPDDVVEISDLSLEIYPSLFGDFLSYIGEVFVESIGNVQNYDVVMDANTLNLTNKCAQLTLRVASNKPKRLLRESGSNVRRTQEDLMNCERCATAYNDVVYWSETDEVDCLVNTIYLNNTGKTTKCVRDISNTHVAPGKISSLFWDGAYDCNSKTANCRIMPLTKCNDAVNDAQFAGIKTLQFYQEYLGVMGGLSANAANPQWIRAYVHYNEKYCNAFYRGSTDTVYFGDCDCSYWTPLTTVDIISHEITHGVTRYSSALSYVGEAGGVNEGMSDIVGTVIEFLIDDSEDVPDFKIGETLGNNLIRDMEFPFGRSFGSVCEYNSALDPHDASGPLDLAFVKAARACEKSTCGGNLRDCTVILGTSFMYSNMQGLTKFSGYLDAAAATCGLVDEFFRARSPKSNCTEEEIKDFIREGWCSVNVVLNTDCTASVDCSILFDCGSGMIRDNIHETGSDNIENGNFGDGINSESPGSSSSNGNGNVNGNGGKFNSDESDNPGSNSNGEKNDFSSSFDTEQLANNIAQILVMIFEFIGNLYQQWASEQK